MVGVNGAVVDEVHRKYHEIANIFPLIQGEEFEALKNDILAHGQREPIWLHPDGRIIDGRNRHRACVELGKPPRFDTYHGDSPVAFSISLNLKRRHLTDDQRSIIGVSVEELLAEEARQKQLAAGVNGAEGGRGNKKTLEPDRAQGFSEEKTKRERAPQSRDLAGKAVGVSKNKISRAKKVKEKAPELFEEVKQGTKKLAEVEKQIRDAERAAEREAALAKAIALPPTVILGHGDFRQLSSELADGSVDLILTDPPYPEEFLPLWEEMARMAVRLLKPGGYLFAYSGQMFLPEIYPMLGRHLTYQWTAAVKHQQGWTRIHRNGVLNAWKPVLIYSNGKPEKDLEGLQDIISGGQGDKDAHEWAQPEAEAAYYIEHLTMPGQTILDPFMGSGTVPRVAHRLKRVAVGYEIDEKSYQEAKWSVQNVAK